MPERTISRVLATLLLLLPGLSTQAAESPCIQEPTARCLIRELLEDVRDQAQQPTNVNFEAQLFFEARQQQLEAPSFPLSAEHKSILASLEKEEQFLAHLQQEQWQAAEDLLPTLNSPLQDYGRSPPQALLLEALTVTLQDEKADALKRQYYATLLELNETERAERMLAVARHEILGGQPDKGQQTLGHSDVDAFSPSAFFIARRSTELLATRSRQLFLQPDKSMGQCDQPADISKALHQWLSDLVALTSDQNQLPDTSTQIAFQLSLARLHHNSAQCPLFETWFSRQAISLSAGISTDSVDAQLQRILIARTVRRYLH